eukprot:scaffold1845_cov291-Prasinococcus_capsulatus_cf.AAC.1
MVNERVGTGEWESSEELGNTWVSRNAFSYGAMPAANPVLQLKSRRHDHLRIDQHVVTLQEEEERKAWPVQMCWESCCLRPTASYKRLTRWSMA